MRNHFRNFKISSARAESDAGAKFNVKFRADFFARQSRGRGAEFDRPCSMLCAATKGENKASGKKFYPRSVALGAKFCARRSGERSENFIAKFCTRQLELGLLRSIVKFNRKSKFDKERAKTSELCPNEFKFNEQITSKSQRNGFCEVQVHKFREFQVAQVCKFTEFRVAQVGKFKEFHEGKALEFKKFSPQSVRGVQNVQSALGVQGLQGAQSAQHSSRRGENFIAKFRDEIYAKAQPGAKFSAGFHAGKNVELAAKFHKAVAAELR
nr:hypothetical protein [uncultured Campylobacter sp.]